MVSVEITRNIFRVYDYAVPGAKAVDAEWFAEDVEILLSNIQIGTTVILDFSYTVSSIIQYTLDGGTTWVPLNENVAVQGGQSRYLRVTSGDLINFRAKTAGTLNRGVLGGV